MPWSVTARRAAARPTGLRPAPEPGPRGPAAPSPAVAPAVQARSSATLAAASSSRSPGSLPDRTAAISASLTAR